MLPFSLTHLKRFPCGFVETFFRFLFDATSMDVTDAVDAMAEVNKTVDTIPHALQPAERVGEDRSMAALATAAASEPDIIEAVVLEEDDELPRLKVAPTFLTNLKQAHLSPMTAWGGI